MREVTHAHCRPCCRRRRKFRSSLPLDSVLRQHPFSTCHSDSLTGSLLGFLWPLVADSVMAFDSVLSSARQLRSCEAESIFQRSVPAFAASASKLLAAASRLGAQTATFASASFMLCVTFSSLSLTYSSHISSIPRLALESKHSSEIFSIFSKFFLQRGQGVASGYADFCHLARAAC